MNKLRHFHGSMAIAVYLAVTLTVAASTGNVEHVMPVLPLFISSLLGWIFVDLAHALTDKE